MKKVLIITLYGNNNFGNKLQNYALQEYINRFPDVMVKTLRVRYDKNTNNVIKYCAWKLYTIIKEIGKKNNEREKKFLEFSRNYLNYTSEYYSTNRKKKIDGFDYYIYGSDQVWNPNGAGNYDLFLGLLTDNNYSTYYTNQSDDDVKLAILSDMRKI